MHPACYPEEILLNQCQLQRTRGRGPGGQHRNKVETAIVIVHEPTGVRAEASERRSQAENRAQAIFRLRVKLAIQVRPSESRPLLPRPSLQWKERVRGGRLAINPQHVDFPALLAEALDTLAYVGWETATAADHLQVTPSQLVKLFKLQPAALQAVNKQRVVVGKSPYK